MIATGLAFLRRDFLVFASYRLNFVWHVVGMLGLVGVLYAISQVVGHQLTGPVQGVSVDYFDFLLAGIAFNDIFTFGLTAFPRTVRDSQSVGTLETMLLTPSRLFPIVLYSSIFPFLLSVLRFSIVATIAVVGFGLWHETSFISALAIFILATTTFACLGALSASFVLVLKQGDPVVTIYAVISSLFGGLLFPVSVLPDWLQPVATFVPLSHALTGMRLALRGAPLPDLLPQMAALAIMTAIFLPASVLAFNWALNRAKLEGSLVQY